MKNLLKLYPWSTLPASRQEEFYRQLVLTHGSPLFVLDEERLRIQYRNLAHALPGVEIFYAVKALSHPQVLSTLVAEGAGLDLATSGEISLARNSGVLPRQTIHTHPIKKDSEIRAAIRFGTTTFVVDNIDELKKFARYHGRVGILLRLRFQSKSCVVDLSSKYGCSLEEAKELLAVAREYGIKIKGFSFHVGSQSNDPDGHLMAIEQTYQLMQWAWQQGHDYLNLLDIGGGFPVDYVEPVMAIEQFCAPIRQMLDTLPARIRIIAEPGRYLVAPAAFAISTVAGKNIRDGKQWYYLDDGVYGSYSGQLFDHAEYPVEVFREGPLAESVLAGPTCDSIDVVKSSILLPHLDIGDLVVGKEMGAYTAATATDFNSLERAKVILVRDTFSYELRHYK